MSEDSKYFILDKICNTLGEDVAKTIKDVNDCRVEQEFTSIALDDGIR